MSSISRNNSFTSLGLVRARSADDNACAHEAAEQAGAVVIVNADDWGRDYATTDRTLDCFFAGAISSVSAMVFMADSERAAEVACQHGIDAGLHMNFTIPYSAPQCSSRLIEHQEEIARTLNSNRFASALYHPRLTASFEYVVKAQLEEYERLYGTRTKRIDGHHHMHLCANVLCQELLPRGVIVRRNLSFRPGEKGYLNRMYRRMQDRRLARKHRLADFFFDLQPLEPFSRLWQIFALGSHANVEIETHPIRENEYRFLADGGIQTYFREAAIACGYILRSHIPSVSNGSLA